MFRWLSVPCFILSCVPALSASEITGVVFNLPPTLTPITGQEVTVRVFAATLTNGLLDEDTQGQLIPGRLLGEGKSNPSSGIYTVPNLPDGPQVVIVLFNRAGEGVTRRIEHLVIGVAAATRLDTTVPEEKPSVCCQPPTPHHAKSCCEGLLSKIRQRLGMRR